VARPLRIEYEGAAHHVTWSGNERRKTCFDPADCERSLDCIKEAYGLHGEDLRNQRAVRRDQLLCGSETRVEDGDGNGGKQGDEKPYKPPGQEIVTGQKG